MQRWGEPRITVDVDLELLAGFGDEHRFIDPLLTAFAARMANAGEFARRHRVLLVRTA